MKSFLRLFGLLIPLSLLGIGCYGRAMIVVGDGEPAVVYHYWYYPEMGVYYDYGAHVYFYLSGSTWVKTSALPLRYHDLGRYVVVESERGRPWARYENHRAKYPPGQWKEERRERKDDERD